MPELNWIGKQAVRAHHREVDFHLLKDVPELACRPEEDGGNLIVQGDNLKESGKEFECAQYLANECTSVETWVRNVERKPGSSSLQTSGDRFYPDFFAKLTDGQMMAVEYKGGHLYTDAEEKRTMSELWEKASDGKCVFAMPTGRDWGESRGRSRPRWGIP